MKKRPKPLYYFFNAEIAQSRREKAVSIHFAFLPTGQEGTIEATCVSTSSN
jgi:hypothetical protein